MVWVVACSETSLEEGAPFAFRVNSDDLAVCRVGDELFAFANVCTHQEALLSDGYVEDGCIECPLHGGRFDLRTGAAQGSPVSIPIKIYEARLERGQVLVNVA
jgi:3-phenylpropionate/trans-cinnamate dioxygenase ferredoxin subunit